MVTGEDKHYYSKSIFLPSSWLYVLSMMPNGTFLEPVGVSRPSCPLLTSCVPPANLLLKWGEAKNALQFV